MGAPVMTIDGGDDDGDDDDGDDDDGDGGGQSSCSSVVTEMVQAMAGRLV